MKRYIPSAILILSAGFLLMAESWSGAAISYQSGRGDRFYYDGDKKISLTIPLNRLGMNESFSHSK